MGFRFEGRGDQVRAVTKDSQVSRSTATVSKNLYKAPNPTSPRRPGGKKGEEPRMNLTVLDLGAGRERE